MLRTKEQHPSNWPQFQPRSYGVPSIRSELLVAALLQQACSGNATECTEEAFALLFSPAKYCRLAAQPFGSLPFPESWQSPEAWAVEQQELRVC